MSETTPTPKDMPGATPAPQETPKTEPTPAPKAAAQADKPAESVSAAEKAELERLRAFHTQAQKWEQRAKTNFDDAERWRQLSKTVGGEAKDFDPQAAFNDLLVRVETSERARTKAEVARTEDVPPKYIQGSTEEEMRASAQEYKADRAADIESALKGRAPAAAPASEVTANGKVAGPGQIKSRDELKNMTSKQIREAQEAGLLDDLLAGRTS